jgi:hypothetical protein
MEQHKLVRNPWCSRCHKRFRMERHKLVRSRYRKERHNRLRKAKRSS